MLGNSSCNCNAKKQHRLFFDGGTILGEYALDLCNGCYFTQNKKFLIREEKQ